LIMQLVFAQFYQSVTDNDFYDSRCTLSVSGFYCIA